VRNFLLISVGLQSGLCPEGGRSNTQFYKKEKNGGMREHAMYKQCLKVKWHLLPVSTQWTLN